jgi:hypothetical protein
MPEYGYAVSYPAPDENNRAMVEEAARRLLQRNYAAMKAAHPEYGLTQCKIIRYESHILDPDLGEAESMYWYEEVPDGNKARNIMIWHSPEQHYSFSLVNNPPDVDSSWYQRHPESRVCTVFDDEIEHLVALEKAADELQDALRSLVAEHA